MGSIELSTFFHMNYVVHRYTIIKMLIDDSSGILVGFPNPLAPDACHMSVGEPD